MPGEWPEYALDAVTGVLIFALVLPALRSRPKTTRFTLLGGVTAILLGIASCR